MTAGIKVITKNPNILVSNEGQAWVLSIQKVSEENNGEYMCQLNTSPRISQVGYLKVVGK